MTPTHLYLTHPQVVIDPSVPVPDWGLSAEGRARVARLAASGALAGIGHVVSSAERKAVETAAPLAQALGCAHEIRPAMHENDRSATGFLPPAEFEAVADLFFAHPHESVRGWETAGAAQARIVREVEAVLRTRAGRVLFVGHGGVGTLLSCHVRGLPIDRRHDQKGGTGGCVFSFGALRDAAATRWRPMEEMTGRDA